MIAAKPSELSIRVTCRIDDNPKGALVKAILHTQYGPPDLLQLKEVDKPAPKANEVLIRIHATTVSTGDCNVRNFTFVTQSMLPIAKLMFGVGKPWRPRILGTELAGEVERVGKKQDGSMETPSTFTTVGWYELGVKPGDEGNAVMDGHVNNALTSSGAILIAGA